MFKTESKYVRILAIDGGGIRGIIPGMVLVRLEQKLQIKSGNPNARLADYFDLIAGTSTGGILTCGYLLPDEINPARPKYKAEDVVNLYLENGSSIFSIPLWHRIVTLNGLFGAKYPVKNIQKVFETYFKDIRLSQLLKPCLVSSYDTANRNVHLFTQHDAVKNPGWDYLVKNICRAASAAPTYFKSAHVKSLTGEYYTLIDGGVYVNNPALSAYSEAYHEEKVNPKEMLIFSLGTGFVHKSYPYKKVKKWGTISWIKPLIDVMMAGVSDVTDYELKQIFDAMEIPQQYVRINTELTDDIEPDMACATPENLKALKKLGEETAKKHENELDRIVEMLLA